MKATKTREVRIT